MLSVRDRYFDASRIGFIYLCGIVFFDLSMIDVFHQSSSFSYDGRMIDFFSTILNRIVIVLDI